MVIARRAALAGAAALGGCSPAQLLNATVSAQGVERTSNLAYGALPRQTLDVYRPTSRSGGLPLIVFVYGGSWRMGSKDMYPFVAEPLVRRGAVVVVPDYRLYPQVAFPSFLQDCALAVRWALREARRLGADPARLVLMGHSAGAYNVAMLALDRRWLGDAFAQVRGTVGLAGPYDFLPITDPDIIPVFAPVDDGPASQPITYVDGSAAPMWLAAGLDDHTVNPANTSRLAARIRSRGGRADTRFYPGIGHVGLITAFAPLFQDRAPVLEESWRFISSLG